MLGEIFSSGDGLEVGLVVVLIAGVLAVRGWFHTLDKRLALLEQRVNPPNQSSVLTQDPR